MALSLDGLRPVQVAYAKPLAANKFNECFDYGAG